VFDKPVVVTFDAEHQSSDGGVILLRQLDAGLKLTEEIGSHFVDDRDSTRTDHSYLHLFRQRVYGIALGYSDCNDAQRVAADPCVRMACGRAPTGDNGALGSQPTLSRFENSQSARAVVAMTRRLEQHVIKRVAKRHRRAKLVTIDLDPSADPTHGQQPFSFFNGHYDTWCYLPMLGFISVDDEPEQFLFYSRLRPGNARCYRGVIPLLRRVVPMCRKLFRKARIRVRLDGGFAHPMVFDLLDELQVDYVVGMPGNRALDALAEPWMQMVRYRSTRSEQTETLFGDAEYRAGSWSRPRRVIIKAEVVHHPGRELRDNARYLVTNLRCGPEKAYSIYCGRGDVENRIKELKDLDMDRTSCSRFVPNQLRLLMAAMAYVLYQEMRRRMRRTEAGRAQVGRLRLMLMKIGTRVVESVRRVVLHFTAAHPWKNLWLAAARVVAADSS